MADAEHRVVYKAFADFTALYAEVAKARAAMAALKRDQAGGVDRGKDISQQRELNRVTREHAAAVDVDAKAAAADVKNYRDLAEATGKLRDELGKLNAERRQYGRGGASGPLELPAGRRGTREAQLAADNARGSVTGTPRAMPSGLSDRDLAALRRELRSAEQEMGGALTRNAGQFGSSSRAWPAGERNQFQNFAATVNSLRDEIHGRRAQRGTSRGGAGQPAGGAGTGRASDTETHRLLARILETLKRCCAGIGGAAGGSRPGGGFDPVASSANAREQARITALEADAAQERRREAAAKADAAFLRRREAAFKAEAAEYRKQGAASAAEAAEHRATAAGHAAEAAEERRRAASASANAAEHRQRAAALAEESAGERRRGAAATADAQESRRRAAEHTADSAFARGHTARVNAMLAEERLAVFRVRNAEHLARAAQARARSGVRFAVGGGGVTEDFEQHSNSVQRFMTRLRDTARDLRDTRGEFAGVGNAARTAFGFVRTEAGRAGRSLTDVRAHVRNIRDALNGGGGGGGGGGDGGGWSRFFDNFGRAGDRANSMVGKFLRTMFSWRGVVIAAVVALGPLVALLGSLGGVALGAANALASLSGTALALPGLFAAAGTGVAALIVGFSPLASVFKAYAANQKQVAAAAKDNTDAQRQHADSIRNAERAYRSAIKSSTDATSNAKRAQQDLNEARRDATRDLQDLRAELDRTALNEEGAILAVKEAEAQYRRTLADPDATLLDRQQALHRVKEAEFDLRDTRQKNIRIQNDAVLAEKKGVEGSDLVVDAKRRVTEATTDQREALERIKDAAQDLKDARDKQISTDTQAVKTQQTLNGELAKLGPNTRKVAEFILSLDGAWKNVRRSVSEALFRPIVGQFGNLRSLLPVVENLLSKAAGALGGVIAKGIEMMSSGPWKRDFAIIAENNANLITIFGDAALYVAAGFKDIAIAAAPFTSWLGKAIRDVARDFANWAANARANGGIARFLNDTKDRLHVVWQIVKNLAGTFGSLYTASKDFTTWMLIGLEKLTGYWREGAKNQEKQGSGLRKWLDDIKPLLSAVKGFLGAVAISFAALAKDPRNIAEAQRILAILADKILPKIVTMFSDIASNGVVGDILEAVATGLDAINVFLQRTGNLPLKVFVGFLEGVAKFWLFVMQNDVLGTIFTVAAVGLAAFVGAAAFAKLTGILKLWDFLRWILAHKGALGSGLLDKILGRAPGETAYRKEGGTSQTFGTYTRQLDTIIGYLARIQACVCRVSGDGGLRAAATALNGSAAQLTAAARVLTASGLISGAIGAGVTRTAIAGGAARLALPAGAAAAGGGGGAVAAITAGRLAAGAAAAGGRVLPPIQLVQRRTWWQQLFGMSASRGAPFVEQGARGTGGLWGSIFSRGGARAAAGGAARVGGIAARATNPLSLLGLALGLTADLGVFGGRGSGGKQAGQAGGAVLTGAGIGAGIGSIVPVVGTAVGAGVGAAAGGAYSLYKDKGLREKVGDFFAGVGHWFAVAGKSVGGWVNTHVIRPVTRFFTSIGRAIGRAAAGPAGWVNTHVIRPVSRFFTGIGRAIGHGASTAAKWVWEKFLHPVLAIFLGIQDAIGYYTGEAAKWVYRHVIAPVGRYFAGLGKRIGEGYAETATAFYDNVLTPIGHFFAAIGGWIAQHSVDVLTALYNFFIKPTVDFFMSIGSWVRQNGLGVLTSLYNFFIKPTVDFFISIGTGIRRHGAGVLTSLYNFFIKPTVDLFAAIGRFLTNLPSVIERWAEGLPGIGKFIKGAFNALPGEHHASGGVVGGTYDGRPDTRNTWLTVGEHVTRKRVVDKPGGKQVLSALNDEQIEPRQILAALSGQKTGRWMDPSALYAGLGAATAPRGAGARVPAARVSASVSHAVDNSKHTGLTTGDITIYNPVRERAGRSLRRTLHASAYMLNR